MPETWTLWQIYRKNRGAADRNDLGSSRSCDRCCGCGNRAYYEEGKKQNVWKRKRRSCLMRWSDLLRMSVSSLRRRKLRTFLTVLGVVIGTASIVVMISLGLGLQESMYKEVEQNGGTTSITVTGKDSGGMMYGYSGMSSDEEESQKYITDDVIKELEKRSPCEKCRADLKHIGNRAAKENMKALSN